MLDVSGLFIHCNTDNCYDHITSGANIYLYECVSLLVPGCAACIFVGVCVCMCVISNQITNKNPIISQISVDLTPCCIKYTARSFLYLFTKASYV